MRSRTCSTIFAALSCVVVAIFGMPEAKAFAEIRVATDLSPQAVKQAIDAAQDGDIVQLPPGTAVWKTGWNVNYDKIRSITIQGAGIDQTIIRDETGIDSGNEPFWIAGVAGQPFRITGITFDGTGIKTAGQYQGFIAIGGTCKNFRVDHCRFRNAAHMLTIRGDTYGLVDHCSFEADEDKGGLVQTVYYEGPGEVNYKKPLSLGTDQAVYFEDNEVHLSPVVVNPTGNNPWIAPNNGARIVVRHNTIINSQLEIYRPGMSEGKYGCQSAEIYDNNFSAVGLNSYRPQGFIFIGAGTAMVFNNTVVGTTYNCQVIELKNERSYRQLPGFKLCDGTDPLDGNQFPSGQPGAGYPCLGQPGRGTDVDEDGVFEPAPCYAWNNTINGQPLKMVLGGDDPRQAQHVQAGRDFFNQQPTDYKPFQYPHPLQGESGR